VWQHPGDVSEHSLEVIGTSLKLTLVTKTRAFLGLLLPHTVTVSSHNTVFSQIPQTHFLKKYNQENSGEKFIHDCSDVTTSMDWNFAYCQ
jgi:hypothetical protein